MATIKRLREEFRVKNFGLRHDEPEDFYKPQFGDDKIYIVCRVLWTVFNVSWIIVSGAMNYNFASSQANRIKWFTFLTNWTYLLLTIHSIILSVLVIYRYFHDKPSGRRDIPYYLKFIWILTNVIHGGSFIVSGLFWIMIFPDIKTLYAVTVVVHTFNSIYVLCNIFLSRLPIRILHCYQVMIYGCIYLTFTAVYQLSGGTGRRNEPSIYRPLNWNEPTKASILSLLGVFVASPLLHLVAFLLYWCRLLLATKLNKNKQLDSKDNTPPDSLNQLELEEIK